MIEHSRLPARFWAKVIPEPNSGCWLWVGALNSSGYGNFRDEKGRQKGAHRLSFERYYEREPMGYVLHKCDNPPCVNPEHLYEGTQDDNMKDMVRKGRSPKPLLRITHCKAGHEYTPENTRLLDGGRRRCRICDRRYSRTTKERMKNGKARNCG